MNPFSSSSASSFKVSRSSTSKMGPGSSSSASSFKTPRPGSLSGKPLHRKTSTPTRSRVEVLKMEARQDIATMPRSPSLLAGHRRFMEPRPQVTGLSGDLAGFSCGAPLWRGERVSSLLFPVSSPLSTVTPTITEDLPTWSLTADLGGSASRKVDQLRKEKKTKPVDHSDFELLVSLLSNLMSDCLVKKEDKHEELKEIPSDKGKGKAKEVQRDTVDDQAENSEMDLLVALLGSLMSDVLSKCEDKREKEHLADNSISMASTSASGSKAISVAPARWVVDDVDIDRLSELLENMMADCLPGKEKEAQSGVDSAMECDPPASGSSFLTIMQPVPQVLTTALPPAVLFATQESGESDSDMPFVGPSDTAGHSIPSHSGSLALMDCTEVPYPYSSFTPGVSVHFAESHLQAHPPLVPTSEAHLFASFTSVSKPAVPCYTTLFEKFCSVSGPHVYVPFAHIPVQILPTETLEPPAEIEAIPPLPELPPTTPGVEEDVMSFHELHTREWKRMILKKREVLLRKDDHSEANAVPRRSPFPDSAASAMSHDMYGQALATFESCSSCGNAKSSNCVSIKGKSLLKRAIRDVKRGVELHPYKGLTRTALRCIRADKGRLEKALKGKKLYDGLQKFVRACEPKKGSIVPAGVPPTPSHGDVRSSANCCGVPIPSPPSPPSVTLVDCDKAETSAFSPLSSTSTLVGVSGPELLLPGKKRHLDEEHTAKETSPVPMKRLKKDRRSFKARFPESDYPARRKKEGFNHEEVGLCIEKPHKMSKDPPPKIPPPSKVQSPISSPFSSTSTLVGTPESKALRRGKNCQRDNEECTVRGEGFPAPVKRSRKGCSRTNVFEQAPSAKSSKTYVESVARIKNSITEASGSPAQYTGSDVVCSFKVQGPFGNPPASPDQLSSWCNRLYRGVKSIFSFWS